MFDFLGIAWDYAVALFLPRRVDDLAWPARGFLWLLTVAFFVVAATCTGLYAFVIWAWGAFKAWRAKRAESSK